MDAPTVVSLICEVISLVTVPPGVALVAASAVSRARQGRWEAVDGVISRTGETPAVYWFDDRGGMHQAPLRHHSHDDSDTLSLWVLRADASRHRFSQPGARGNTMRVLGLALLVPGVVAIVIGFVATLL